MRERRLAFIRFGFVGSKAIWKAGEMALTNV
jgi:hypothetical protein